MYTKCSKCKRILHQEVEKFKEKYVSFGVVEKKEDCKECDYVDASDLQYCVDCGNELKEP